MSNEKKKQGPDREIFEAEMERLMSLDEIKKMSAFSQHHGNNTLQHVRNVAYRSFQLAEQFGWDIDEKRLARGAMLHDYYLYTVKQEDISDYRHGIGHPKTALKNAREIFDLTQEEENIIRSHMWPLTIFHAPRCREAVLVCLADKDCAIKEMFFGKKNLEGKKKPEDLPKDRQEAAPERNNA